jgi:hypothetical protein
MAFKHGKLAEFGLGSAGNLTDYSDNIEWSRSREVGESTVFGLNDKTYVAGLRDATFTVTGKYDSTATTGPAAILNAAITNDTALTFTIQEEGTGASNGQITGSCFATGYSESVPVGGVITWSADFQVTGPVTTTNQA